MVKDLFFLAMFVYISAYRLVDLGADNATQTVKFFSYWNIGALIES